MKTQNACKGEHKSLARRCQALFLQVVSKSSLQYRWGRSDSVRIIKKWLELQIVITTARFNLGHKQLIVETTLTVMRRNLSHWPPNVVRGHEALLSRILLAKICCLKSARLRKICMKKCGKSSPGGPAPSHIAQTPEDLAEAWNKNLEKQTLI